MKYQTINYPFETGENLSGKEAVLSVRNLAISFKTDAGYVHAVRGVSFDLYKGETLCIVGESGSGKSVTNKTIMGILPRTAHIDSGSVLYEGEDLTKVSEDEFHKIRGTKIGMIFQDPLSSLNPIMKIGKQITEVMLTNGDHLKSYFNELINEEFIKLKKDQRMLHLEKDETSRKISALKSEIKSYKKGKKKEEIEQSFIDSKNKEIESVIVASKKKKEELFSIISSDKKALAKAKKEARAKVNEKRKDIYSRHFANLNPIISELFKFNEFHDLFSKEHRRFISELKAVKEETKDKIKDLSLTISNDKKALAMAKKDTRIEFRDKRNDIKSKHSANLKPILSKLFKFNEFYDLFLEEHRRFISELRVTHKEAKDRALKIMAEVGIPEPERRFKQYPFEFSGGMRQRIVIAIALTAHPDVLICDEPTTALDVTIQAQILELINELKAKHNMSVIFITHDLGVVANMADRVAVMYAGKIVEYGTANDVFYDPKHPYTWALLSSIPDIDSKEKLEAIPGTPPNMLFPPVGDAFANRSKYALGIDFKKEPPMFKISPTHYCASWLLDERAPNATMPKIVSTRIKNNLNNAKEASHE